MKATPKQVALLKKLNKAYTDELTNEASAETKLAWAMPCKEEEDDSQP